MSKPEPLKNKMKTMIGAKPLPKFNFFFADDVKSACEFYLRYRDSPELFVEEYPEYTELLNQEFGYIKETKKEIVIKRFNYYLYNEWLFKLAFNFPALTEGRQQPTSHENSERDSPMKAQTHAPLRPSAKRGVEAEPQQAQINIEQERSRILKIIEKRIKALKKAKKEYNKKIDSTIGNNFCDESIGELEELKHKIRGD